jgi:hypothetical protein
MGLRDIEMTLPPGFRFYPSDEELVCHYLHNKVANHRFAGGAAVAAAGGTMVEVDLHIHEPWELPGLLLTPSWFYLLDLSLSLCSLVRVITYTSPSPASYCLALN